MVFEGNCARGRTDHMINGLNNWNPAEYCSIQQPQVQMVQKSQPVLKHFSNLKKLLDQLILKIVQIHKLLLQCGVILFAVHA